MKVNPQEWYEEKKITVLVQLALDKHPELPDVPLIVDLAKTDEQRQILKLIFARQVIGRPFLAPPGIPAERADALRKAFMDTMKDKCSWPTPRRRGWRSRRFPAIEIEKLMKDVYATPEEIGRQGAAMIAR